MKSYEYNVIPAPKRGLKGKGIKGTEAQFANALAVLMNEAAAEGWEYQRAETLPAEERQGLRGRTTVFQNMLVFRRPLAAPEPVETAAPTVAAAVAAAPIAAAPIAAAVVAPVISAVKPAAPEKLILRDDNDVTPEEPDEMYEEFDDEDASETPAS